MLAKIKPSSHLKLIILLLDIAIVFTNYIQIFLLKGNLVDSKILLPAIDSVGAEVAYTEVALLLYSVDYSPT